MGADVEMKDEGKDAKKEGEKEEEIVKLLDVLDVVRDPPSPGNATALVDSACPSRPHAASFGASLSAMSATVRGSLALQLAVAPAPAQAQAR